jgi:hypothetical protein
MRFINVQTQLSAVIFTFWRKWRSNIRLVKSANKIRPFKNILFLIYQENTDLRLISNLVKIDKIFTKPSNKQLIMRKNGIQ